MKHVIQPVALTANNKLNSLVENRTAFSLDKCELNIFETHQSSYNVPLTFNDLVITSMLRGKKIMHLFDHDGFDYLPGESVIVPPAVTMNIDFPEANSDNPTQCTALAIDRNHIESTLYYLNDRFPRETDDFGWQLNYDQYHFYNNPEIAQLTNKIVKICTSSAINKDIFADLTLKELLVSIMQNQHLQHLSIHHKEELNNPLAHIVGYIKNNIHEKLKIDNLSTKACMSKATFYRVFKRELGISPIEFIFNEKIAKAKELLRNPKNKLSEISNELGFSDANYFIRIFKKKEGVTPMQYRNNKLNNH